MTRWRQSHQDLLSSTVCHMVISCWSVAPRPELDSPASLVDFGRLSLLTIPFDFGPDGLSFGIEPWLPQTQPTFAQGLPINLDASDSLLPNSANQPLASVLQPSPAYFPLTSEGKKLVDSTRSGELSQVGCVTAYGNISPHPAQKPTLQNYHHMQKSRILHPNSFSSLLRSFGNPKPPGELTAMLSSKRKASDLYDSTTWKTPFAHTEKPFDHAQAAASHPKYSFLDGVVNRPSVGATHSTVYLPLTLHEHNPAHSAQSWQSIQENYERQHIYAYPKQRHHFLPQGYGHHQNFPSLASQSYGSVPTSNLISQTPQALYPISQTAPPSYPSAQKLINLKPSNKFFQDRIAILDSPERRMAGEAPSFISQIAESSAGKKDMNLSSKKPKLMSETAELPVVTLQETVQSLSHYKRWRKLNLDLLKPKGIKTSGKSGNRTREIKAATSFLGDLEMATHKPNPTLPSLELYNILCADRRKSPLTTYKTDLDFLAKLPISMIIWDKQLLAHIRLISDCYKPNLFEPGVLQSVQTKALDFLKEFWQRIFSSEGQKSGIKLGFTEEEAKVREYLGFECIRTKFDFQSVSWLITEAWMKKNLKKVYASLLDDNNRLRNEFKLLINDRALLTAQESAGALGDVRTSPNFFHLPGLNAPKMEDTT
ncbi:hypothetical protein O181_017874 [Austropuccinia psidii MF-1]|uniref:Uncharacterized protein n=1 Tax=Austropuccinia psidii MF-1 TaxID=1389203 RepID=A0A9Q3C6J7_9BASI|nr:hypothetical protein [Austropuccinia psidii MF-1]